MLLIVQTHKKEHILKSLSVGKEALKWQRAAKQKGQIFDGIVSTRASVIV